MYFMGPPGGGAPGGRRSSVGRSRPAALDTATGIVAGGAAVRPCARLAPMRHVLVIGVGAGDPDHVTAEAARAIARADVVFTVDKGDDRADLAAVRRRILERH